MGSAQFFCSAVCSSGAAAAAHSRRQQVAEKRNGSSGLGWDSTNPAKADRFTICRALRGEIIQEKDQPSSKSLSLSRTRSAVFFLNKLKQNSLQRRKEHLASKREKREQDMKEEEEKKDLVSAEPTTNLGSSELCYFCQQQLYVLERGSAEGKFFHRSCFTCQQCGTTLRQGGYTFYPDTGRFYCEQHSEPVEKKGEEEEHLEQADLPTGVEDHFQASENEQSGGEKEKNEENKKEHHKESQSNKPLPSFRSVRRKSSYKISTDPHCDEITESNTLEDQEYQLATRAAKDTKKPGIPTMETDPNQNGADNFEVPVPAPRGSRNPPLAPVPKPRTVHNIVPSPTHSEENQDLTTSSRQVTISENEENNEPTPPTQRENGILEGMPDSRPKQPLKKLQLSVEEKTQLMNLSFSQDSDSETPASSSAASTSSSSKPHDGGEEEGYWSGGPSQGHIREQKHRRCFRKKGENKVASVQPGRVRSKFSPWNLSSPRLRQRFSVLLPAVTVQPDSEDDVDAEAVDDEDDDDENEEALLTEDRSLDGKVVQMGLSDTERQELMKMKTLERRAKMSEMQRFRKAQSIQRRLEEIEVTFKDLEEKGVILERSLRGQPGPDGSTTMIDDWIELVQQKNDLVTEESDLMVASRQLELEDKQSMLELELRRYMEIDDSEKTAEQQAEEEQILQQMLDVVDMRNSLVAFLEEKRLKEISEEELGSSLLETKRASTAGAQVHWA